MARFRLMVDHYFETQLNEPIHLLAGAIVDTATMPAWFKPSAQMHPLDGEAQALLAKEARAEKSPLLAAGSWSVPN